MLAPQVSTVLFTQLSLQAVARGHTVAPLALLRPQIVSHVPLASTVRSQQPLQSTVLPEPIVVLLEDKISHPVRPALVAITVLSRV